MRELWVGLNWRQRLLLLSGVLFVGAILSGIVRTIVVGDGPPTRFDADLAAWDACEESGNWSNLAPADEQAQKAASIAPNAWQPLADAVHAYRVAEEAIPQEAAIDPDGALIDTGIRGAPGEGERVTTTEAAVNQLCAEVHQPG